VTFSERQEKKSDHSTTVGQKMTRIDGPKSLVEPRGLGSAGTDNRDRHGQHIVFGGGVGASGWVTGARKRNQPMRDGRKITSLDHRNGSYVVDSVLLGGNEARGVDKRDLSRNTEPWEGRMGSSESRETSNDVLLVGGRREALTPKIAQKHEKSLQ
jgi:hypothetical protein